MNENFQLFEFVNALLSLSFIYLCIIIVIDRGIIRYKVQITNMFLLKLLNKFQTFRPLYKASLVI